MPRIITLIVFIFCAYALKAQEQGILVRAILYKGDTIPSLQLPEVVVKAKTRNPAHYRRYNQRLARLEYNVRKVYPYAQIAAAKINEIEKRLAKVSREAEKKNGSRKQRKKQPTIRHRNDSSRQHCLPPTSNGSSCCMTIRPSKVLRRRQSVKKIHTGCGTEYSILRA
ncbi:MAG: DUF4294 domain-containing protein [Odoribacter splanchnicus]|nr:DUF4294 domain-containing protein [Odoribacter splanchnicus]